MTRASAIAVTQIYSINLMIRLYLCELFPTFGRGSTVGLVWAIGFFSTIPGIYFINPSVSIIARILAVCNKNI